MIHPEIASRRLLHQRISYGRFDKPEQVVRHLGAMQAQDYHQVLWAIGVRMQHAVIGDIEQSIAHRQIVLTWPMRGTIHCVPPEDVRWMLKLLSPRILAKDKRRLEQLELTTDMIERCKQLAIDALQGGRRMTRPDLMQVFEEAGISTTGQRGYHLLWHIAQAGLICMGPREGKQQTFVLLDEWVPLAKEIPPEEALALLTERYFRGHGPATVQDLAWWTGLTLTDARKGVEAARNRLISETIAGRVYWRASAEQSGDAVVQSGAYLLPGFDEYFLGYQDRTAVVSAEHARFIVPGNNGVFMPIIVVDGQVAGIWKRSITSKGIDIIMHLFYANPGRRDELMNAAAKYGEFMGLPLTSTDIQVMDL
ncbi:Winged helix DNA-binding domain-containing protein [Paenibacillus sp. UNCCL117]|uniref:winged helix DNA-binding domain-containing protein n=1 Tax=unclassified Paenibacillus TaxID=185978 RepID=UPI00088A1275|nr:MULTISPECIES: winged helix DNA-binding domain-containing protein [unclassified Paenibacillus]SDD42977.1 Winged helix DNA-binding domain-containing protein [Paenibacillus sp. cl123]SFW47487.1 Winged helix DNA-binding domain-containing protein [Paenibacillus sp. UNCCL117]